MKIYYFVITIVLVSAFAGILSLSYGQWQKHEIDTKINWGVLLYAADIDDDGDLDIVCAGEHDHSIFWYENSGGTPIEFTRHAIDDGTLNSAIGVYVADIDGDGDLDVAATGFGAGVVVWYENMGGMPISWIKHIIDRSLPGAAELDIADIDGDDTLDVIVTGFYANDVVWYKNMGGTPISWHKYTIDPDLQEAGTIDVYDLDKDGDQDVIATGNEEDAVIWYENMGGSPVSWTPNIIDGNLDLAFAVRVADMDGDDTLDVIATGQNADDVIWYENNHPIWTPHPVAENLDGARCLYITDIDGDDNLDVVATGFDAGDVVWYENIGGMPIDWSKHNIDENLGSANDVITADLDGDNDQDVIATGLYSNRVIWYENLLGVAMVNSIQSYPGFIPKKGDSIVVNAQLYNPENHPATVQAIITGEQHAFIDTLQLYDDGLHHDNLAADNIWGNSKWLSDLPEDMFRIKIYSFDVAEEFKYHFPEFTRFTTCGPVRFDSFEITSADTIANPGDQLKFNIYLRNDGETAITPDISAKVTALDSYITVVSLPRKYGDIAPAEIAEPNRTITVNFSQDCPNNHIPRIKVDIFSGENLFWADTIQGLIVGLEDNTKLVPVEFSLKQNYPNPFNPKTIINYELRITNYVDLSVYNLLGQKVAVLVNKKQAAGSYQVEWDASGFSSGVYLYKLKTDPSRHGGHASGSGQGFEKVRKLILLK